MPGTVLIAKSTHIILRQWSYETGTDPYFVAEETAVEFTYTQGQPTHSGFKT